MIKKSHPEFASHLSESEYSQSSNNYLRWQRVLDLAVGVPLLVLFAPVIAICAIIVKVTSRGPAIYSQVRMGRLGKCFRIYKLRSMANNCEGKSGPQWSRPGDSRVTTIGKILRATKLDELPQLWNVVKGDMSLVGPRPERPEFLGSLEELYPQYGERLLARPGITGLAAILLPADTDMEEVGRKLGHDRYYVQHMSLGMDLRILFCTAVYLLEMPLTIARKKCLLVDWNQVEEKCRLSAPRTTASWTAEPAPVAIAQEVTAE